MLRLVRPQPVRGRRGHDLDRAPLKLSAPQADNRADARWADIDVQPKRRHDLVPYLVEVVSGYGSHERGTFPTNIAAWFAGFEDRAYLSAEESDRPVPQVELDIAPPPPAPTAVH